MVYDISEVSLRKLMGPFGFRLLNSPVNAEYNTLRKMLFRMFQSRLLASNTSHSRTPSIIGETMYPLHLHGHSW